MTFYFCLVLIGNCINLSTVVIHLFSIALFLAPKDALQEHIKQRYKHPLQMVLHYGSKVLYWN